jgi:Omp85 superfamily domain
MRGPLVAVLLSLTVAEARADEPPPDLGTKVAAVPIVSYGSDELWGFGARFKLTDFGDGTRKPFVYSIEANIYATTGGIQSHWLALDLPQLGGSPYRLTLRVGYARAKYQPYYGLGNGSVHDPDADRCSTAALEPQLPGPPNVCPATAEEPANPAFRGLRFYQYDVETFPNVQLTVLRPIAGPWSLLLGYHFLIDGFQPLYRPDDYGQDTGSQLTADAQRGILVGWNGRPDPNDSYRRFKQRYSELVAGVRFDTRDNEFAPTRGMFHELSVRGAAHALGSESNVWGANLTLRLYQRPIPSYWRLVFALRLLADVASDGLPFYRLPATGGISEAGQLNGPDALGGRNSNRGLELDRYQGNVKLLGNAELRWRLITLGDFELGTVGAIDAGRVWARLGESDVGPVHVGTALGLRVAWGHHLIVRADFGLTPDFNFFLDFGETF